MKFILCVVFLFVYNISVAQDNNVIQIQKYEQSDSAIIVSGVAKIIPVGTKMWVLVKSINGKPIDEHRNVIKSVEDVIIANDRTFKATIQRYGSLNRYDFPEGKYKLEFYACFNRAWQSLEVAKDAGVKLDNQGRSDGGDPKALLPSPDLQYDTFIGQKVRVLRAFRTIDIKKRSDEKFTYRTKKIRLEINDSNSINNPVRTIPATDLLFREVRKKIGRLKPTQAVALVCVGSFHNGFGFLANDIYLFGGEQNPSFKINFSTTLAELCYQQEDDYNKSRK